MSKELTYDEIMNIEPRTFRQAMLKRLVQCGLFPDKAGEVIAAHIAADDGAMEDRWDDALSGYPDSMLAVVFVGLNATAVKWIDENMPNHFARPMFATQPPEERARR
jgi:hypothetical protein